MADLGYNNVAPPSNVDATAAFQDALKRAKEIAARMGSAGGGGGLASHTPGITDDGGRKRSHENGGDEPHAKKSLMDGIGLRDPKQIAMQVAASITQKAGLGAMTMEEIKVPNRFVGLIIGKGGEQINKLQTESGAKIQVAADPIPGQPAPPDRAVTITGGPEQIMNAKRLIQQICDEGKVPDALMSATTVAPGETVIELMIPASKVGLIIGKGGETIKNLQERAQCRMVMIQDGPFLNAPEKPLRITGDVQRAQRGKDLVEDLLTEKELEGSHGHGRPDFQRGRGTSDYGTPLRGGQGYHEMAVAREVVGFVIGKSGETIKRIQKETNCRVQFKQEMTSGPTRLAQLQGSQEEIDNAIKMIKDVINQSQSRGGGGMGRDGGGGGGAGGRPQAPSGPGIQVTDIPVPANKCGVVIGKGGETIRAIFQATGCFVELNRNSPEGPTKLFTLKGTESQIQNAQKMVRDKIGEGGDHMGGNRGGRGGGYQDQGMHGQGGGGGYQQGYGQQQQQGGWQGQGGFQGGQGQGGFGGYGQQSQQPSQQQQQYGSFGNQPGYNQQPYGGAPQQQVQQPPSSMGQQGQQQPAAAAAGGQGQQPDYSAAWAAYYQHLYQQQAAAAAASAAPTTSGTSSAPASSSSPSQQSQAPSAAQAGQAQPDYSAAWAEFYRQQAYYYPYAQQAVGVQPQPGAPGASQPQQPPHSRQ